jgi:hypothetical protein
VYHLDEATGSASKDSSVSGYNCTPTGNPTQGAGEIQGALSFNGSTQYTSRINPSGLNFERTDPFTVSYWVKPNTASTARELAVSKIMNVGPYTGWYCMMNGYGSIRVTGVVSFGLLNAPGSNSAVVYTSSPTHMNDGNWHLYHFTSNGSSTAAGLKIYEDRIAKATTTQSDNLTASIRSTADFDISGQQGGNLYNGAIDEVHVAAGVRSPAWITTEYNNQSSPGTFITMSSESCAAPTPSPTPTATPRPTPTPTPTPTATPAPGLVAAYGFNEGSGTLVHDVSGNGNNGTISGATWTTSGKYGKALNFNGTNARVNINNATSLQLRSGMTLEAWVYRTSVSSAWRDVIYKGNDNYYLEGSSPNSSRPAIGGTFGGNLYGTSPLTANTWAHLAATYNGATMRLYVNGVQVASRAQTGVIATSTNPLQIGGDSIYGQYFAGRIDEVRIYNQALSAAQIQRDMNTAL